LRWRKPEVAGNNPEVERINARELWAEHRLHCWGDE
jgi:hypothetical protein